MTRFLLPLLSVCSLTLAAPALAADPRTDGPEGSEVGKGGYNPVGGDGRLGLEVLWGAAAQSTSTVDYSSNTPLFFGAVISYWFWDWFSIGLQGDYHLATKRISGLIGPRFRTGWSPITLVVGLDAGAMLLKETLARPVGEPVESKYTTHFGLSPTAGFELTTTQSLLLGLHYAADFPIGVDALCHRIYLDLGWRF